VIDIKSSNYTCWWTILQSK